MESVMYANADPIMPYLTPSDPYSISSFLVRNESERNDDSSVPPSPCVQSLSISDQPSPTSRMSSATEKHDVQVSTANNSMLCPESFNVQTSSAKLDKLNDSCGKQSLPCSLSKDLINAIMLTGKIGNPSDLITQFNSDMYRGRRPFKPSTVWDHFLRLSDGNVQCAHCAKVLKRKDSSTKTMWGHLRAIHFKGQDLCALQRAATKLVADVSDAGSFDSSTEINISTQSWLEEQVGISRPQSPRSTQISVEQSEDEKTKNEDSEIKAAQTTAFENTRKRPASELNAVNDGGTPTQPYVKRNRSVGGFSGSPNTNELFNSSSAICEKLTSNNFTVVRAALSQHQQKAEEDSKTMTFLASIPRASEVIKITAGFSGENNMTNAESGNKDNGTFGDENSEVSVDLSARRSAPPSSSSPSISSTNNQLQAEASCLSATAATNSLMYMAAANALSHSDVDAGRITFSLEDVEFLTLLVQLSKNLDCRFTFECRGAPSFRIEPHASSDSRIQGTELVFVDLGTEIRVTERHNGVDAESETWRKMDFTQFSWAIQGKCQKFFVR